MGMFMNPSTKFGFLRIFGQEKHKRILMDFLNAVFEGKYHFDNVNYQDAGIITGPPKEQSVIHGIFCTHDDGTPIILEWQNRDIVDNFMNRVQYFQSKSIASQIRTVHHWTHIPLYVYILDFVQNDFGKQFRVDLELGMKRISSYPEDTIENERDEMFSGELEHMVFLQFPEFTMTEVECVSTLDRWVYILKNMQDLDEIPWVDENDVFAELAQVARLDGLTQEERIEYEKKLHVSLRNV